MKFALHDLLRRDRLRGPWFLLILAIGGLALLATSADRGDGGRGGDGRATDRDTADSSPSVRRARADRPVRKATADVGELVAEWLSATASSHREPRGTTGIFVSSRSSPERTVAFRKLLGEVTHDNAGKLHEWLDACPPGEPESLGDEEWTAFLDKWGRLDGPGAVGKLAASEAAAYRIPEVVGGWAAADPDAAESWLRELPEHPWKPAAVSAFAESTVRWEPERALASALSIEGPWRTRALHLIESRWPADAPDNASASLEREGYAAGRSDQEEVLGYDLLLSPRWSDPDRQVALPPEIHLAE